ncbi:MAG TPA: hypothetical protein VKB88_43000 [Bryobacteraceae bacterium]|nr:hypothetical protein [Bryobacteraceae bacterium]
MEGGATPVISSNTGQWRGPGHEAVLDDSATDYLVFHAYKASNGTSALQISTVPWDHGWPTVGTLP